jgi:hypothetical protein
VSSEQLSLFSVNGIDLLARDVMELIVLDLPALPTRRSEEHFPTWRQPKLDWDGMWDEQSSVPAIF